MINIHIQNTTISKHSQFNVKDDIQKLTIVKEKKNINSKFRGMFNLNFKDQNDAQGKKDLKPNNDIHP